MKTFVFVIFPFIYLFLRWLYYYGEGTTESMLWKISKAHTAEFSATYHQFREYVENMGHRVLVLIFTFIIFRWIGLLLWLGAELSGLCLYELRFRHIKYGDWKHVKDDTYKILLFGKIIHIRYPSGTAMAFIGLVGVILFLISTKLLNII